MIGKLRRKFTLILMSVVTIILLAIFVSMLLSTVGNTRYMRESMLRQALMMQPHPQGNRSQRPDDGHKPRAPVLVVEIGPDGGIFFLNNQYLIEADEAIAAAQAAYNSGTSMGVLSDHGLRWMKSADGSRLALADISMEQEILKNLILNSLMIGSAALAVFFLASLLLSRWAVRPVALAWERQRQFVADASHELKTPLTVILSNADMLRGAGTFDDKKKARRLEHIQAEAVRMKKLVVDLLMLAKSDSTESVKTHARVNYSFLVTNAALTYEPIAFDDKKSLAHEVQDKLFVAGDAQRLRQLIAILLDNAIKYCPSGGQIKLSLQEGEKKTALLVVTNDGELIPEEQLITIFQRFYRLDRSRSAHGGFGLGLSIAESIVREHGGTIWAESSAKSGNSFFVAMPLG